MKKRSNSLVVGGTRGIGSVIAETLTARGDKVFTASRRELKENDGHISVDLSSPKKAARIVYEKLAKDPEFLLDSLVFSQRYRGDNADEELINL